MVFEFIAQIVCPNRVHNIIDVFALASSLTMLVGRHQSAQQIRFFSASHNRRPRIHVFLGVEMTTHTMENSTESAFQEGVSTRTLDAPNTNASQTCSRRELTDDSHEPRPTSPVRPTTAAPTWANRPPSTGSCRKSE